MFFIVPVLHHLGKSAVANRAATGSLAKLLSWNEESPLKPGEVLCHQADYVALNLMSEPKKCGAGGGNRRTVSSDWHNVLKCGYDVRNLCWPDWLVNCLIDWLAV